MKKIHLVLITIFSLIATVSFAQNETFSKVKIWLGNQDLHDLHHVGVATDHGSYKKDTWFVTDLAQWEIQQVENAGFVTEILIEDVSAYYVERNNTAITKGIQAAGDCVQSSLPEVDNFSLGSMGGFFTYQEMLDNLDAMQTMYPNLISSKAPVGTFLTHENRPVYWTRISNNPTVESTTKPEILYTAVHHAREPASMSQLIYYMWYVLENYDTSDDVKYVVDNTEMFFVPCINPDGYIYNELTDPNGGGMHRKNRRDVGTNNKGVDLNRNYSYEYGGVGTSTNPNDDTYRGSGAFSEPETQAMKWLAEQHEFKLVLNYHAYADMLLFPWGYTDNVQCEDHELFENFTEYLVRDNGYLNQQSSGLYPAAGDSDDWAYGDTSTKPKSFAMTPEVGGDDDGFWPAQANILSICQENVHQNLGSAKLLLDNVVTQDLSPSIFSDVTGTIPFDLTRLGLQDVSYVVSINPLGDDFASVGSPITISGLGFGDSQNDEFDYTLQPANIENGTFGFVLTVATPNFTYRDTLTKYFGNGEAAFEDNGGDLVVWSNAGSWGADSDAYSPSSSTSDSPLGSYNNNETNTLVSETIILQDADVAFLNFYAKWNIEAGWDYAQISAKIVGQNNWQPLCGNYTVLGNENQDTGEPLYDGVQNNWVQESVSLNDFLGEDIQIRYQMVSDGFVNEDGFKFDDLVVTKISNGIPVDSTTNPVDTTGLININKDIQLGKAFPNPTNGMTYITYDLKEINNTKIVVTNMLGQVVFEEKIQKLNGIVALDTKNWNVGTYLYRVQSTQGSSQVNKLILFK